MKNGQLEDTFKRVITRAQAIAEHAAHDPGMVGRIAGLMDSLSDNLRAADARLDYLEGATGFGEVRHE